MTCSSAPTPTVCLPAQACPHIPSRSSPRLYSESGLGRLARFWLLAPVVRSRTHPFLAASALASALSFLERDGNTLYLVVPWRRRFVERRVLRPVTSTVGFELTPSVLLLI